MIEIYEVLFLLHNLRNPKAAFPSKRPDKAERGDAKSGANQTLIFTSKLHTPVHMNVNALGRRTHKSTCLDKHIFTWLSKAVAGRILLRLVHMKSVQLIESFMYRHHVTYPVVKWGGGMKSADFQTSEHLQKIHIIKINAI